MADDATAIDDRPGYRRRLRIAPAPGRVTAELEDDYHCMTVTVDHADGIATAVAGTMHRAPWTTCPGAEARLRETFVGVALAAFAARGEKNANCTHLYDLATLAAAHAHDDAPLIYDVLRSDPVDGLSRAELRRDGATLFAWTLDRFRIVAPAEDAGIELFALKPLLGRLDAAGQEAARVLRWGIIVGSGREIPLADQSDAGRMPANCYTFQPAMAARARRVGVIRDLSAAGAAPLDGAYRNDRDGPAGLDVSTDGS